MKDILQKVMEEHIGLCYENTEMALELICETLYYRHNINAKYQGRSIYVGKKRVASIEVSKESYKCVGIYKYWIF